MKKQVTFYLEPITVLVDVKEQHSKEQLLKEAKKQFVKDMIEAGGPEKFKYSTAEEDCMTLDQLLVGQIVGTSKGRGVVLKINKVKVNVKIENLDGIYSIHPSGLKKITGKKAKSIWETKYPPRYVELMGYQEGDTAFVLYKGKVVDVVVTSVPRSPKGKYKFQIVNGTSYFEITENKLKSVFQTRKAAEEQLNNK